MIIAAHAGTGKTIFASQVFDSVDFVCMPYKYYLPDGAFSNEEVESKKADLSLEMRDEWPGNYIKAVINQYNENRYVVIPPIAVVLEALRKEEIPYILCYPERTARAEYERRYKNRGNTEAFLDIFIRHWDMFLNNMESDPGKYHMVMKSGEYLTDLYPRFEEILKKEEVIVPIDVDDDFLELANEFYKKTGYTPQALFRRELIRLARTGEVPEYMMIELDKLGWNHEK